MENSIGSENFSYELLNINRVKRKRKEEGAVPGAGGDSAHIVFDPVPGAQCFLHDCSGKRFGTDDHPEPTVHQRSACRESLQDHRDKFSG